MTTTEVSGARDEVRAKIRDDLIRRLFAVAISVGAATTIAQMKWVQGGRWPCMAEWQQLSEAVDDLLSRKTQDSGRLNTLARYCIEAFAKAGLSGVRAVRPMKLEFAVLAVRRIGTSRMYWQESHAFLFLSNLF